MGITCEHVDEIKAIQDRAILNNEKTKWVENKDWVATDTICGQTESKLYATETFRKTGITACQLLSLVEQSEILDQISGN